MITALALLTTVGIVACQNKSAAPPPPLATPQTPPVAERFDFPLDPEHFGPYIPHVSGSLAVDTRFGAQNPGVGKDGKCFVNLEGTRVPFDQLYHAGEDWFAIDQDGQVEGHKGKGVPVHAVANGVVTDIQAVSRDGYAVIVEHHLPKGNKVWSVYWHVSGVQVAVGEAVTLGQRFAHIQDQGFNSHLHWEIRTFGDGRDLFSEGSAGERGTCNGYVMGVGYTWDDDPARARPEAWGYLDPVAFVEARQSVDSSLRSE
jgi:hypothetical protein